MTPQDLTRIINDESEADDEMLTYSEKFGYQRGATLWSNRCLKLLEALEYVKSHQSLLDQNDFDINNYADKAIAEFKKDVGVKE